MLFSVDVSKAKNVEEEEEETDDDGPGLEDLQDAVTNLLEKDGPNKAKAAQNAKTVKTILERFGTATVRKLDKSDYGAALKAFKVAAKKK